MTGRGPFQQPMLDPGVVPTSGTLPGQAPPANAPIQDIPIDVSLPPLPKS
jgi:hypothetical protein